MLADMCDPDSTNEYTDEQFIPCLITWKKARDGINKSKVARKFVARIKTEINNKK